MQNAFNFAEKVELKIKPLDLIELLQSFNLTDAVTRKS
jgi:hypothetical protein